MKDKSKEKIFRVRVFVLWAVGWNVLGSLSLWANGGVWRKGEPITPLARQFLSATCFGTAAIPLAILMLPSFRTWALHPDVQFAFHRKGLWILVAIFGVWGTLVALPLLFKF
jgi:hypothetical protein